MEIPAKEFAVKDSVLIEDSTREDTHFTCPSCGSHDGEIVERGTITTTTYTEQLDCTCQPGESLAAEQVLEVVEDYERTGPIDVDGHYDWGSGDKEVTVTEKNYQPIVIECAPCYEEDGGSDWYTVPVTPEDVVEEIDGHWLRCGGCGHEVSVVL